MSRLNVLRALLTIWVLWHLAFGVLATFWPEAGASAVGWQAEGGWSAELVAMSTQYGMVMVLLAGMYAIMLADPLRYLGLVWVAVAEQALGIAYATYIVATVGQLTTTQFALQAAINIAVAALFVALWRGLKSSADRAHAA